ncbi:putative RNA-directed DNA polymerase [Lupinus albus]|uniref:Putative RNA-directed DNA polymerase n=1 Tax=Lupinus albus TaxID=3870 RepID=A0A6A4PBA7_LUPAL|nr:putative RNA-directed DNA polymerase [Lupinus albus]
MKVPSGLKTSKVSNVCNLQKSLYGLKQASRQWNTKLSVVLINNGYVQSKDDYSLFIKNTHQSFTTILVYVDDLVLVGDNLEEIESIKQILNDKFSIKDLGNLKYFLGMEVARTKSGINLCQRRYCLDLLQDVGLLAAKPASTPMDNTIKLHSSSGSAYTNPTAYRRMLGKLIYLTHTRPDVSFSVSHLSQFISNPTIDHYQAGLRILRYLKNAPAKGLFFSSSSNLTLKGFSDSDWGACLDTRRSVIGYCFFLGDSLVSWKCKRQKIVSRSSA